MQTENRKIYADIVIDIAVEKLDKTFQYRIPDALAGQIEPGTIVEVPFGKGNRIMRGYVMETGSRAVFDPSRMKDILAVVKDSSLVEEDLIRLAGWMKINYGSTMVAAMKTVFPVRKQIRPKEKKFVVRTIPAEEARERLLLFEKKHQVARYRLMEALIDMEEIPCEFITEKLNVPMSVMKALEEQGLVCVRTDHVYRNPMKLKEDSAPPKLLSESQQKIVDEVCRDYRNGVRRQYLIHGITGSGKTEVYMEIAADVVRQGKQVIVLIPEIALTYQTVMRFYKRFGDRVSTLHSRLSAGERFDQFERAKQGGIDVMIGPRSALFTPFRNLGLIVMDEEHEGSYKSETMPKYHAREVAQKRAALAGASFIMGSATPSLEAYYRALRGEYKLFVLKERATGGMLPSVYTIDLRDELRQGNRSVFSGRLRELMEDRLSKKEQTMLFLNRRGFASFVSCRKCGHVMKCPHCDVALSSHKNGRLVCHYCGFEQQAVKTCPECGSGYIGGMRAGTEQIEQLIKKEFPQARVLRMDADTTREKNGFEKVLAAFSNGEADILVGTQMIVKGHDFPEVTLVGILAADLSLYANDYRAGERTFQLLTQAAGRAGRGQKAGEVVIQTYSPDHYSILAAAKQDYEGFYREEIEYRSFMGYPPVSHLMAVLLESQGETECAHAAEVSAGILREMQEKDVQVIGPAPASVFKLSDYYRYVLYLKCTRYEALTERKDALESVLKENTFKQIRVQFDFDPVSPY